MADDLAIRITIEHGVTTVTSTLDGECDDIHAVIEAVDYALRGIGFDPGVIERGFRVYAGLEDTDGGETSA